MGNLGFTEIMLIMVVVLLLFGAKRLPEVGASIGKGSVVARSIVMDGAVLGEDTVVSSSVVLPGAVVAPGSLVVDQVITGAKASGAKW